MFLIDYFYTLIAYNFKVQLCAQFDSYLEIGFLVALHFPTSHTENATMATA